MATDGAATTSDGQGPQRRAVLGLTFAAELSVRPCVRPLPGWFPGAGQPGKGWCGDGQGGGPESVTLAGRAERARAARAVVSEVFGPGHPCGDDAVLLVSEDFGNSVRHSGLGAPR
jgi:hypothetical protein